MNKFDIIIIGAGPGGYVAAIRAAQLGMNVALIEKNDNLGGTCLNVGCIPSKALLESSELFYQTHHKFAEHGILAKDVQLDLSAMMQRKEKIVATLTGGIAMLMKKNKVTVLKGKGVLKAKGIVVCEELDGVIKELHSDNIILAMGSVPVELPFLPFDNKYIVSSTETLSLDNVPEKLVVIGAGAIGLEMGSIWARLGSEVTILEMLPRIAPFADSQLSSLLHRSLTAQGLVLHTSAKVTGAIVDNGVVKVSYTDKNGENLILDCNCVLVAVGRKPNSRNSGLEEVGVQLLSNGMVEVDERFKTSVEGVYAIGDLIRGPMLAHKASEEGIAVVETIAGLTPHINYDAIPNIIYTDPEMAVVGINEEDAKERNINFKVGKMFFRGNGRALSLGNTDGMAKFVVDADTDRVLGVHILGPRASELIAELTLAIELGATAHDVAKICYAHPTLSEVIKESALSVDKRAIHS